jgi:erythritol transport system substrate-binding protein
MVASVLQPIVEGTQKAAAQLDSAIKTGQTGAAEEKQALDCTLINKENADKVKNFILSGQ